MSGAIEAILTIINIITRQCGETPKRLIVPKKLWEAAYLEFQDMTVYKAKGFQPYDRFHLNGVEVRIE